VRSAHGGRSRNRRYHGSGENKAQELVRNLDTISLTAAPELAIAPSKAEAQTIAELDQEISSNLDQALASHFETVDAVLDTAFEEQAAIVQQINHPLPVENPQPIVEPAKPELKAPEPAEKSASAVVAAPDLQQSPPDPIQDSAPPAAPTPPLNALDEALDAPQQVALPPQEVEVAPITPPRTGVQRLGAIVKRAAQPAVPVLVIVNFPLRLVPQSMRSAVDWLALTLLVWVPIVWIMVFALGTDHQASTAVSPHTHEAQADSHATHAPHTEDASHAGH
jgi:hypothetical protein